MSVMRTKVEGVIQSGRPLRVAQAAWLLNVSVDKVYAWIQEGLLEVLPGGKPFRVSTKSVLDMLKPVYSSSDAEQKPGQMGRTASSSSVSLSASAPTSSLGSATRSGHSGAYGSSQERATPGQHYFHS